MDVIFSIHSYMRWLVTAMVLITLIKLAITWSRNGSFGGADRGLLSATVGFIDLQVLLGLILLFGLGGGFPRFRVEHGVTMLLAAVAAHMTARYKKLDGSARARKCFIALLIAAVLIVVGVMRLPGGPMRGM